MKKTLIYASVYLIMTLILSYDDIVCAWRGEQICQIDVIGKFVIFIIFMLVLDRFILKKKTDKNE